MELSLVQFAPPGATGATGAEIDAADGIRTFVFMANLAAQEATGDSAASTSPERVVTRLKGSTESQLYLFAAVHGTPPLAKSSELGLPLLPSTGDGPEPDYAGFIHISLPLLEETANAEIECVLDADYLPIPGQPLSAEGREVADWLAARSVELAGRLGRSVLQVGVLSPGEDVTDPMAGTYRALGFHPRHAEVQVCVPVPKHPALPDLPPFRFDVWPDYDIPDDALDDVMGLLTVASTDAYHGSLSVEPIQWTRARLADAHARLRDRRAHTLLVALRGAGGGIDGLAELSRQEFGDPEVAEWTLVVTRRDVRGRGIAKAAALWALRACREYWPDVERTYASHARQDAAVAALARGLGAQPLSYSEAWELHTR